LFKAQLRLEQRKEEASRVSKLIADLDSDDLAVRDRAFENLLKLGDKVQAALKCSLGKKPGPEVRSRVEKLLEKLEPASKLIDSRDMRVLEVLEAIHTAEARSILEVLATEPKSVWLMEEATAALRRLGR